MIIVRIEHAVPDFTRWKQAFDSDPADRRGSGVRHYQILRAVADPNYVMVDLEFESLHDADAFLKKMQRIWEGPGKSVMQKPASRIVERIEEKCAVIVSPSSPQKERESH